MAKVIASLLLTDLSLFKFTPGWSDSAKSEQSATWVQAIQGNI